MRAALLVCYTGRVRLTSDTASAVRVSSGFKPSPMPPVQLVCPCHISSGEMWLLKGLSGSGLVPLYILLILSKNSYYITVLGMELVSSRTYIPVQVSVIKSQELFTAFI